MSSTPRDTAAGRLPPACNGCVHFFVTYQPGMPYGCRAMGFKSRNMPCVEVLAASGSPCQMRQSRNARGED